MKRFLKIVKNEDGQVLVLLAAFIVVLLGFAALVIDIGMVQYTKIKMQNATDAAALAGAMDLPNELSAATTTAENYALDNGAENTTAKAPYEGDPTKIEVTSTKNVQFSFARIFLESADKDVSARAVAKKNQWEGEALPYINLDDDYLTNPEIEAWEKVSPGDFESIDNYKIINPSDPKRLYFKVDYMNGVELKKGTVASIKEEVGYVYDQHKPDGTVYLISLNRNVINSGEVKLKDGTIRELSKLKNDDVVDLSQLVLLECIFHDYDGKGHTLYLTFKKVYDIANNELPPDYKSPDGVSKLIE